MQRLSIWPWLLVSASALATVGACGTDAVGVEACRRIELARCDMYVSCGLTDDREACHRFYRDQCLGGVPGRLKPNPNSVDQCVAAIQDDPTCALARTPESSPACSFLVPVVDGGTGGTGGSGGAPTGGMAGSAGNSGGTP